VTREALEKALSDHLPEGSVQACADLIIEHRVFLKITRSRLSKYGDYRAPSNGKGHRISLNYNLNPYMFLVTFVHEIAHLTTYNRFKRKVDPHGKEWKSEFKILLDPFLRSGAFPAQLKNALENYMVNPAATNCSDTVLFKALKSYDKDNIYEYLENLPEGCEFKLMGYSDVYIKGKPLRKTFLCMLKENKKRFRISAVAEVQQVTLF
jgi:SprT protein